MSYYNAILLRIDIEHNKLKIKINEKQSIKW